MGLKTQNIDGRLSLNGIRHLRQYVATGHTVSREDVLALIEQHLELDTEAARLRGVLSTLEREHAENMAGAWAEGWIGGTDAVLRQQDLAPEERILALATAAADESNPYAALLDAPIVEDLPEPIGGER